MILPPLVFNAISVTVTLSLTSWLDKCHSGRMPTGQRLLGAKLRALLLQHKSENVIIHSSTTVRPRVLKLFYICNLQNVCKMLEC